MFYLFSNRKLNIVCSLNAQLFKNELNSLLLLFYVLDIEFLRFFIHDFREQHMQQLQQQSAFKKGHSTDERASNSRSLISLPEMYKK